MKNNIVAFPVKAQDDQPKKKKKRGERKDGLIQRSWQYERLDTGERDREYFYGHSGAEADRKKEAFKKEYYEKKEELERQKKERIQERYIGITVGAWVDEWKSLYKANLKGYNERNYRSLIKRIKSEIGDMRVEDVLEADIQRVLNNVSGKSSSTVRKLKQMLNSIFSRAIKNKIIRENPVEDARLPERVDGSHRALEDWEIEFIMTTWQGHRMGRYVMLALLTGISPSEEIALKWPKIDLEKRVITINEAAARVINQAEDKDDLKTVFRERDIPICEPLYQVLSSVPEEERVGYVVKPVRGNQHSTSSIRRGMSGYIYYLTRMANGQSTSPYAGQKKRKALQDEESATNIEDRERIRKYNERAIAWNNVIDEERSKLKNVKFTLYDLRHTFCSALYDADVDIKTAQYLMGHGRIETTMRIYTYLSEKKKRKAVASMVGFLDAWISGIKVPEKE